MEMDFKEEKIFHQSLSQMEVKLLLKIGHSSAFNIKTGICILEYIASDKLVRWKRVRFSLKLCSYIHLETSYKKNSYIALNIVTR